MEKAILNGERRVGMEKGFSKSLEGGTHTGER